MQDVVVVGCGILGATIAKAMRAQAREVVILDNRESMAGTLPSGGHLKPSWFSRMKRSEYEPAMELLSNLWGLREAEFTVRPTGMKTTVYRVDTDVVVKYPRTIGKVVEVSHFDNYPRVVTADATVYRCRLLVIAAGVWCSNLLPEIATIRKQGVSFRLRGTLEQPFIKPWAPYKQVVAHQQADEEIWIGDGSAILPQNWTAERTEQCLRRCRKAVGELHPLRRTITGLRPYCQVGSDPCLLRQLGRRAWVATGAAKLGTIAAGWAAKRLVDATS